MFYSCEKKNVLIILSINSLKYKIVKSNGKNRLINWRGCVHKGCDLFVKLY